MADKKTIFVETDIHNLSRAICDVAMASFKVADGIFERIAAEDVTEIEEHLKERLTRIFGETQVVENEEIIGASSKKWGLSAVVHINTGLIAFQAVSTHANSVNRASTAFHDLRELPNPPARIAVVKDKEAMGVNLNILAQAGKIIQSDQADDIYERAAA